MRHLLQMYYAVEFFNDKSVAVVAEARFYNAGSVLWPKKHRQRSILLENNQRPPDGTKAYAVKVLKSGLTLQKARQAARRAENTDNLSSSEPRQLGRDKRIRHIRKLISDSDDEDSPNQPKEPTGWPAPRPILQQSTIISSYVSTATISMEFSQQVQKNMAEIKGQLANTNVWLAALEKRNDFLAEQLMALHSSVQQMQATLSDVVNALQRASSVGPVTSSSLNLPLCTEEAHENFLRRLSVEDGFANEAVCAHLLDCFQIRQLAMVGGRNEADFLRNLLTVLLGPPLCHNFCWAGGCKEKKSFMACPLFSVLKASGLREGSSWDIVVDQVENLIYIFITPCLELVTKSTATHASPITTNFEVLDLKRFDSSVSTSSGLSTLTAEPSPIETGYRNKAEFTIGQDGGGKSPVVGCRLGKYCKGSTRVASPSGLPIFSDSILRVVCQLQGFLDFISNPEAISDHPFMVSPPVISLSETSEGENQVSMKDRTLVLSRKLRSYDLISRCGHWSSALVRETRLGDILLRVELHRDNLTDAEINDMQDVMKAWFSPGGPGESAQLSSLCLSVLSGLSRAPGSFTDNLIFGNGTLTELCCGLKFTISMDAFFQVNTPAAEILYKVIKELCLDHFDSPKVSKASVNKTHKIDAVLLDICCGTGTIGLCLAECFESVVGIELVAAAVENARHNAELNGITNAKFLAGRAELLLNDVIRGLAPDKQIVAILDPPRAGVHPGVIEVLRRCSRIRQLIFVACDLAAAIPNFISLARPPSKKFIGDPFLPTLACCVDLFPQTPNIEVVVVLERLPARDCGEEHQF
ncbi:tRNA methyltransferase 2 [Sparganum proliferum]